MNETGSSGYISAEFVPYRKRELRTYFIRSGETIKIGSSREPQERLSGLQTAVADDLELLVDVPFSILTEDQAHGRFAHIRIRGEWFTATPELIQFIEDLRFTGKVPPVGGELVAAQIYVPMDDSPRRNDLLAARNGARRLRNARPDLWPICEDIMGNAELQMKHPGEPCLIAAGSERARTLAKMLAVD